MNGRELLIYLSIKYKGNFEKIYKAIKEKEPLDDNMIKQELSKINLKQVITILDKEYPNHFKTITSPPLVLYYKGDISLLNTIEPRLAVVGSRENSEYGEKITRQIVKGLITEGANPVIVSGLSRGIDAIAHDECLKNNGKTIGVLGCGIDYIYPKANESLYKEIENNGLLISEYPGTTAPEPDNFPMRNRLIAGASDKVLVTEAYKNSGTNLTVLFALKQGKDVMSVPHEVGKESSCNKLIQDGAYLVENADDVDYLLNDVRKEQRHEKNNEVEL